MHGQQETSQIPRTVWVVAHFSLVLIAAWIYFGGGIETVSGWVGWHMQPGNLLRRQILIAFGAILWVRMSLTAFILLKRKFDWNETGAVITAVGLYQLGFALFGASADEPIGALDFLGIALFCLGSYLNTGSELQRKRFKEDPHNKGKLFTQGLFRLARHINYFGDSLWLTGWAILTRNLWAGSLPLVATLGFIFLFIPQLSVYLKEHYGKDYDEWAKHTARLIPFIY